MTVLEARGLEVRRGSLAVLRDVSLTVGPGDVVGLAGPNGAGKSTLLGVLAGLLPARRGELFLGGRAMLGWSPQRLLRSGLALVPQGHRVFPRLTVHRNLEVGGTIVADRHVVEARISGLLERYPALARRRDVLAGRLSGGEQTLLVLCRALVASPNVLLLDEPLLGVASDLAEQVLGHVRELAAQGAAIVVVEHDRVALASVATRVLDVIDGGVRS
ncbi:MAG: ATP-binding cassette domain-containing protein [Acidimicrobiales bacterium]